jgi:hypothetical protein
MKGLLPTGLVSKQPSRSPTLPDLPTAFSGLVWVFLGFLPAHLRAHLLNPLLSHLALAA